MALTIMNPAVIEPSHMPKINLTANKPPKFVQAACEQRATPQTKMLILGFRVDMTGDMKPF